MRFLVAILTLHIVAGVALALGGWRSMSEDDQSQESFKTSVEAAAAAYNSKYIGENGGERLKIRSVGEAEQQVVSGMRYRFAAVLSTCSGKGCDAVECTFVVWYQAWRHEKAQVQQIEC